MPQDLLGTDLMLHVSPNIIELGLLPVVGAAFLIPGWLLSRVFPVPTPIVAAFIGSCTILHSTIIWLEIGGAPLHRGTVGLGIVLVSVTMATWLMQPGAEPRTAGTFRIGTAFPDILWTIPCIVASVSVLARIVLDPLSGFDNGFRWDYLARLMVARESLSGYPPVTAEDFEYYAWCDSIPPMAASLNFLIYSMTGSTAPSLTAIRVAGEAVVVAALVSRNGQLLWGDRAGLAPVAVLSSSALALWSLAIGQETGLTTISLLGLLYFLELHRRCPAPRLLLWAALAASLGALAREYGLSFIALGCAFLLARRRPWREWTLFLAVAAAVTAPWYVRTWLLTGNPLFPMTLGGLFPGNSQHDAVMADIARTWSIALHSERFATFLVLMIGATALAPCLLGLMGAIRLGSRAWPMLAAIALIIVLWLWSIPYTGGGWMYSARVLLPALVLLAALSGWLGTTGPRFRWCLAGVLALITVDAARRAWFLPWHASFSPMSLTIGRWSEYQESLRQIGSHPVWSALVVSAQGGGIIVDHPANHALITLRGGRAVPIFSPALRSTFDPNQSFEAALAALRADGIRLIALPWVRPENATPLLGHPFWDRLHTGFRPNAVIEQLTIFDLADLQPALAP